MHMHTLTHVYARTRHARSFTRACTHPQTHTHPSCVVQILSLSRGATDKTLSATDIAGSTNISLLPTWVASGKQHDVIPIFWSSLLERAYKTALVRARASLQLTKCSQCDAFSSLLLPLLLLLLLPLLLLLLPSPQLRRTCTLTRSCPLPTAHCPLPTHICSYPTRRVCAPP